MVTEHECSCSWFRRRWLCCRLRFCGAWSRARIREEIGKLTDNKTEQLKGKIEQVEGKAQEEIGKAKRKAGG